MRRATRIKLTDKGQALAPTLFTIAQQVNETFTRALNEHEQGVLQAALQKLVQAHPKE